MQRAARTTQHVRCQGNCLLATCAVQKAGCGMQGEPLALPCRNCIAGWSFQQSAARNKPPDALRGTESMLAGATAASAAAGTLR